MDKSLNEGGPKTLMAVKEDPCAVPPAINIT